MLMYSLVWLLLSNSITSRRDKSIMYSRTAICVFVPSAWIVYDCLCILFSGKGIGIFGGLFYTTTSTNSFHTFVFLTTSIILLLTSFYPRKLWSKKYSYPHIILFTTLVYYATLIINKMAQQFTIIEYPLIILFTIIGSVFLMATNDLVSIFICIELQSYGLYILTTIYRDSEPATFGGLMYFLLGGLSSCLILLGTSLLYSNSGTTSLDNLYIITDISTDYPKNFIYLLLWYQPYYIHISLLFMAVGFLFKVSAAPFHFWSPDVYDAIPTIVTTFVAIIAKISIFILLLELVHYTGKAIISLDLSWTTSLLFSSLLSLVIGTVVGLTESRIKRLFAFSTISHVGFILLGLTIHTVESTQAFIFYLTQYSISNLNAFMLIITIGYSLYCYVYSTESTSNVEENQNEQVEIETQQLDTETQQLDTETQQLERNPEKLTINSKDFEKNPKELDINYKDLEIKIQPFDMKTKELEIKPEEYNIKTQELDKKNDHLQDVDNSPIQLVDQLKGYYYINPTLSLSLAITLFSFAGIPPLMGFFGKQTILSAAIDKGYFFMSITAVLTSVIGAVYYLNIIKQVFFDKNYYNVNDKLEIFNENVLVTTYKQDTVLNNISININNIVVSTSLSLSISFITLVITLFIFIPQEWLSFANLLALLLFNL